MTHDSVPSGVGCRGKRVCGRPTAPLGRPVDAARQRDVCPVWGAHRAHVPVCISAAEGWSQAGCLACVPRVGLRCGLGHVMGAGAGTGAGMS